MIDLTAPLSLSPSGLIIPPRPSLTYVDENGKRKSKLPNIKKLLLPEPGWIFCDADLQQADAQVVAWDSGDEALKNIFKSHDKDLHTENAKTIFGECPTKDHPNRKKAKAGVHAVNYHVFAQTLAGTLKCSVEEAQHFIDTWFKEHPDIKKWHQRVFNEMNGRRYVENAFGNRKVFYDATDNGTSLSEALAWIPQSTVAIVINKVWEKLDKLDRRVFRVMMQVHDSLCFQIKQGHLEEMLPYVEEAFASTVVPYDDPLVIGSSMAVGPSWGEVIDISWNGFVLDPSTGKPTDQLCMYMRAA